MRHFVAGFCCLMVGLQVLIGVPLAVCIAFHVLVAADGFLPVAMEVHSGHVDSPATIPPPNRIPACLDAAADNPLLRTRLERGSPLAGTVLEPESPAQEQSLFLAAVEQAAAEHPPAAAVTDTACTTANKPQEDGNEFVASQLYALADFDEQGGRFDRADQWRALAREIRAESVASQADVDEVFSTVSQLPGNGESPR